MKNLRNFIYLLLQIAIFITASLLITNVFAYVAILVLTISSIIAFENYFFGNEVTITVMDSKTGKVGKERTVNKANVFEVVQDFFTTCSGTPE